jgi:hypothetical protein
MHVVCSPNIETASLILFDAQSKRAIRKIPKNKTS